MANNQLKDNNIERENNLNHENINLNKLGHRLSDNSTEEIDDYVNIYPKKKRIKISDNNKINSKSSCQSTQKCDICHQKLNSLKIYKNDICNGVDEDIALTDEKLHLSIDGNTIDDDLSPTYKMINFSVFDTHQHLCRLDTGLIDNNVPLYCSGYIVPIFDENPTTQSGVPTTNIGPINEWYTTGFDGGENVLVCISTQYAEYYLLNPSQQYKSFMDPVYEKAYMSKLVIEFITTKDNPTYEDLIDELQMVDPPEGIPSMTEESLLKNVQFICDQVTSLDINSDDSDNFPLLQTSCMRSLISLTGATISKTNKSCKSHRKSPVKKRKKSWITPAMTNLVQEIFEKFYPQNQEIKVSTSKSGSNKRYVKRKYRNETIWEVDFDSDADEDDITAITQNTVDIPKAREAKITQKKITWHEDFHVNKNNRIYYNCARVGNISVKSGDYVIIDVVNPPSEQIAQLINMWEEVDGSKKMHVNWYLRGKDTILGNIAEEYELFSVDECSDISLKCIKRQCVVKQLQYCTENAKTNRAGEDFYYEKRYVRESARFEDLPTMTRVVDDLFCSACDRLATTEQFHQPRVNEHINKPSKNGVSYGVVYYRNDEYRPGNGVYISPSIAFVSNKLIIPVPTKPNRDDVNEDLYPEYYRKYFTGDHVKGSNYDTPEPFDIGYIREIYTKSSVDESKPVKSDELWVEFNRMYRCEDTHAGSSLIQTTDINILYWSDEIYEIPCSNIMGKCYLTYFKSLSMVKNDWTLPHRFYFTEAYDAKAKVFCNPPSEIIETFDNYNSQYNQEKIVLTKDKSRPLKTLDIFAGCGGLSAGLIKAGVADVRWAVERDRAAARAFQANHPQAVVYQSDCNSLLEQIMRDNKQEGVPQRGDVELLCGGPPCQGFSGLNRFTSTQYSYLKNTLFFTFLSYCDYYKPKFVIMENVLNFTLHNKGMMLKIAMYYFLRIGYQCTFAILQGGNFGLPQSRRRTILLAAASGEKLPMYPEPLHVFSKRACQLDVMIDGKKFSSNCLWKDSAPYRTICVRDAISDLPTIENGNNTQLILYGNNPISDFQRKMRNTTDGSNYVSDHICKKMSPLVLARIENIPKVAGADWRDLPNIVVQLSDGTFTKKLEYHYKVKKTGKNNSKKLRGVCSCAMGKSCDPLDRQENTLIPWCLPHTGNRQYGWAGTYGRLDWNGFFGTTITNPEPLGKQGRVLHPEQSRVVSVRECARSQGFPDNYRFEGTLIEKYRQIGNAVPPPLAEAIGHEIKRVI